MEKILYVLEILDIFKTPTFVIYRRKNFITSGFS